MRAAGLAEAAEGPEVLRLSGGWAAGADGPLTKGFNKSSLKKLVKKKSCEPQLFEVLMAKVFCKDRLHLISLVFIGIYALYSILNTVQCPYVKIVT